MNEFTKLMFSGGNLGLTETLALLGRLPMRQQSSLWAALEIQIALRSCVEDEVSAHDALLAFCRDIRERQQRQRLQEGTSFPDIDDLLQPAPAPDLIADLFGDLTIDLYLDDALYDEAASLMDYLLSSESILDVIVRDFAGDHAGLRASFVEFSQAITAVEISAFFENPHPFYPEITFQRSLLVDIALWLHAEIKRERENSVLNDVRRGQRGGMRG